MALLLPNTSVQAEKISRISLNTIGYLPNAPKRASIVGADGAFRIERLPDETAVLEGTLSPSEPGEDANETIAVADFSRLAEPGEYRLVVAGIGPSARFRVAVDLYREPFIVATRAMYLWRCGAAVSGEHHGVKFEHEACHLEDAYLDFVGGGHVRRESVGGWHDAGDYNKYIVNAGVTVGVMFRAWEDFRLQIESIPLDLPESGDKFPDFLAELKWEIDWLLTMQADDGSVYHKLSTKDFGGFIPPEQETEPRYFTPWSTAATADFIAMLAMAARYFAPYDAEYSAKCLAAARKSHAFLQLHPEERHADHRGFKTGGYDSPDGDDRLWADAEMWATTGDAGALAACERQLHYDSGRNAKADVDWDWPNVRNLGLLTYLFSERGGRDPKLVEHVREGVIAAADEIVQTANEHGYARPLGSKYYWGCNGTVARQTLVLQAAFRLTGNEAYRAAGLDALNHLFGRNYYGRSFVTGLGRRPPLHPHDRRSGGDMVSAPWPGYLVGGPNPKATDWRDLQEDYRTNETAINWNGALIYALAAYLPTRP